MARADIPALLGILGKGIQYFTIKYAVSCGFLTNALYQLEKVSFLSYFAKFLSWADAEFCQIHFLHQSRWLNIFFAFVLFMSWITWLGFKMLSQSYSPGINSTWSWCTFFFIYRTTGFSPILLRMFFHLLREILVCNFLL